jgi:GxxExxY protein
MELYQKETTDKIIEVFYTVYWELGYGFLEKVYHNSMLIELRKNNLKCESQRKIQVRYKGLEVGDYFSDIVVNNNVILELKASDFLLSEHEQQLINYLKATNIEIGLLLNFGKKPEIRRKIFTNDRKKLF